MLCPVHPRAERVLFVVLVNAFWHCVVFVSTHVFFFHLELVDAVRRLPRAAPSYETCTCFEDETCLLKTPCLSSHHRYPSPL